MISVIVPTYNRVKLLRQALESLVRQTIKDFEVIVVDDGGSQDSEGVVKDFQDKLKIKFFKENHGGVCQARNIGIKNSSGDVLAFFDDDAVADPHWLEKIEQVMPTEKVMVGRGLPYSNNLWQYFAPHYDRGNKSIPLKGIWECNLAVKREVFDKVGMFDEKIGWGHEGNEFAHRCQKAGYSVIYYPEVVIYHDYASGFLNYLSKQFKFGQKYAYLKKRGIDVSQADNGIYNEKLEKLAWPKKFLVKIIARIGAMFHQVGELNSK